MLLSGRMTYDFPHDHWTAAVQDYLDGKPLMEVHTAPSFVDMVDLLPPGRQSIILINKLGQQLTARAVMSLRCDGGKGVELPVDMHIVQEAAPDRGLPDIIRIDCTGLGGHDLGGPIPWHICIRTDRHGQNIYGPSLATIETTVHHSKRRPMHTVGKTRSAAILVVGLLVFEPNLNLMILTKENVAAQAFAEHIEAFRLPPSVTSKIGRLVGYMELKKNKTNKTSLDVTFENRHEVLRQKKLLIGCGGGFQQECSQSYSPVARWITEVALTLTDESQQYGNIEETSVIARTPRPCLNIWAGDHRQTPGGLKNTVECRLFRQKLLQRPLALRCGTDYVQPHEMHRIVSQYLDGPCDSPSHQLKLLLEDEDDPSCSEHITAVTQLWCEILHSESVWLNTSVCVTCFAILWLAVKGERVSSPVANTLDAAAGLARRQKWGLILPSSARVSRLTYQRHWCQIP